jgi:hypothetical protein
MSADERWGEFVLRQSFSLPVEGVAGEMGNVATWCAVWSMRRFATDRGILRAWAAG